MYNKYELPLNFKKAAILKQDVGQSYSSKLGPDLSKKYMHIESRRYPFINTRFI